MISVFGITGPIGHGKTFFAELLVDAFDKLMREAYIRSFATPVKKIAREQFGWDGKKDEKGRRLLRILGTEAGRHYNPDIWVNKWRIVVGHRTGIIIADDVRFENEARAIRNYGGKVIHILRDGIEIDKSHESDAGISLLCDDLHLELPCNDIPQTKQIVTELAKVIVLRS